MRGISTILINLNFILLIYIQKCYYIKKNHLEYRSQFDEMSEEQIKQIWGKLVPLTKGLSTYALKDDQIVIGRSESSKINIKDKRLSGNHCTILKQHNNIYLVDNSTNGTWIFAKKIEKKVKVQLKNQSQIWLLPISKVTKDQVMGFKIVFIGDFQNQISKNPIEQQKQQQEKKQEDQNKKDEQKKTQNFMNSLKEQITCPYCAQIMLFPVCIQPCNHRMCGHCLTQIVNLKKDACIICRKEMISAARDATFNSIIDDYFRTNPSQRKEDQDKVTNIFGYQPKNIQMIIKGTEGTEEIQKQPMQMQIQKQHNSQQFQKAPTKNKRNKQSKKQTKTQQKTRAPRKKSTTKKSFISSDISASTDSEQQFQQFLPKAVCKQCTQERNNFKCDKNQPHVNCHNCSKLFAKREGQKLYQNCTICNGYFCNLYIPPCQKSGVHLSLLGKRIDSCKLEQIYFRGNKVEMNAFKNLLISQKKTEKSVFNQMLQLAQVGRFEFLVHKKILRNPPLEQKSIRLHKRSTVCDNCWRQVWFQMMFMFVKENAYLMPESIKGRPICYYGVNCKTVAHNAEHMKRYNHMEFQTRFH